MNAWKKITIQMSTFGFSPTLMLDAVWFESASKENSGTVYLDDIQFTAGNLNLFFLLLNVSISYYSKTVEFSLAR